MKPLSDEQKRQVATWVRAGATISDVQKRLESELGVKLTYLDTRFLVDDLDLTLIEKPKPAAPKAVNEAPAPTAAKPAPAAPAPAAEDAYDAPYADDFDDEGEVIEHDFGRDGQQPGARVSVEIDALNIPGTMLSGSVTFSDGQSAVWYIDQMGRVGLKPKTPGYQPSPTDVQQFQLELQAAAQRKGYI